MVILSTASAFKFPGAVLRGLGVEAQGDAFAQMDALARLTGEAVPRCLSDLREKQRLHFDCIDRGKIVAYVREKLGMGDGI